LINPINFALSGRSLELFNQIADDIILSDTELLMGERSPADDKAADAVTELKLLEFAGITRVKHETLSADAATTKEEWESYENELAAMLLLADLSGNKDLDTLKLPDSPPFEDKDVVQLENQAKVEICMGYADKVQNFRKAHPYLDNTEDEVMDVVDGKGREGRDAVDSVAREVGSLAMEGDEEEEEEDYDETGRSLKRRRTAGGDSTPPPVAGRQSNRLQGISPNGVADGSPDAAARSNK
jgi:hypothetical protein